MTPTRCIQPTEWINGNQGRYGWHPYARAWLFLETSLFRRFYVNALSGIYRSEGDI